MKRLDNVAAVKELRGQVEQWRQSRPHSRSAMPEELWQAATVMAKEQGVYPVSTALSIGYKTLKRRLQQAQRAERHGHDESPQHFVSIVVEPEPEPSVGLRCKHVCFEAPDGATMTIHQPTDAQLLELAAMFWSRRA